MLKHWVGYDYRKFVFILDYEVFLTPKILRAGCNEIESNIANCRMYLVVRRELKRR